MMRGWQRRLFARDWMLLPSPLLLSRCWNRLVRCGGWCQFLSPWLIRAGKKRGNVSKAASAIRTTENDAPSDRVSALTLKFVQAQKKSQQLGEGMNQIPKTGSLKIASSLKPDTSVFEISLAIFVLPDKNK